MSAERPGWNECSNFLFIVESRIQRLEDEGFITAGRLISDFDVGKGATEETIIVSGPIVCAEVLFINVQDALTVMERADRPWVRLNRSRYHAGVLGQAPRAIFRYDNAHAYPGHPDAFHKHQFDPATW